jgi:hypothetical protein
MTKRTATVKLNSVCLGCRQKCKQADTVIVLGCSRYRRKDMQLELKFTFDKKRGKKKK